jgi:hypothetical protein
MADGFHIDLDAETVERLKAAAEAAGVSPSDFVADVIRDALEDDGLAESRRRLAEYRRTGAALPIGPVLKEFRRTVAGCPALGGVPRGA